MPQPRSIVPPTGVRAGLNSTGSQLAAKRILRRDPANGVQAVQLAVLATQVPFGVSMSAIEDGRTGDVQVEGKAIITSGGVVAIDGPVTADAQGRAVAAVATNVVIGRAVTAAAGADEDIEVELKQPVTL